jgi:hypothetical protein
MSKIYIHKDDPRFFQVFPIPDDLENWNTIEWPEDDLHGKIYEGGTLVPDPMLPERKAKRIRMERDKRLSSCDWTVLPDVTTDSVWLDYRQALRDITEQSGFPDTVVWPEEPA